VLNLFFYELMMQNRKMTQAEAVLMLRLLV